MKTSSHRSKKRSHEEDPRERDTKKVKTKYEDDGRKWDTRSLGSVNTITFVDDNRRFMTTSDLTSDNECLRDIPVDMDTPIQRCTRCSQVSLSPNG
ncbi:hypothetical protein pipiens_013518 [Culex pipiens pipiens]|uniref:Uncharacterized protein n=1 Tax=Culex pipiens pipiens TaxID=38569 RepID=A0ABD1CY41_CULPP